MIPLTANRRQKKMWLKWKQKKYNKKTLLWFQESWPNTFFSIFFRRSRCMNSFRKFLSMKRIHKPISSGREIQLHCFLLWKGAQSGYNSTKRQWRPRQWEGETILDSWLCFIEPPAQQQFFHSKNLSFYAFRSKDFEKRSNKLSQKTMTS